MAISRRSMMLGTAAGGAAALGDAGGRRREWRPCELLSLALFALPRLHMRIGPGAWRRNHCTATGQARGLRYSS